MPRVEPEPYEFVENKIPSIALDQDIWWRDRSGKLYRITDMYRKHAENAAKKLYAAYGVRALSSPLLAALCKQAGA